MSKLIEMMEKLGSDASLQALDESSILNLEKEIENSEFPKITSFIIAPAEDDDNDENPDNKEGENTNVENILLVSSI